MQSLGNSWYVCIQVQTWCDDGAYMLANQLVDKFQSKDGAQSALKDIEKFLEGAPPLLNSGLDILSIEYEGVITPQLQVCSRNILLDVKQQDMRPIFGHILHLRLFSFCSFLSLY